MHRLTNPALFRQACFINGKWQNAQSSSTISVINPFNNQPLGTVPDCNQVETKDAINAAYAAYEKWKNLAAKTRADLLNHWADLIEKNQEDLATILTLEQGKTLAESRSEITYANGFIRWFAEEGRRIYGETIPANNTHQRIFTIKQPVGVVAVITPWNFPCAMITRKIAPALAVGCTAIVKPDSQTPFSALALAALAEQAGFPPGTLNVITGDPKPIGTEMTTNPLVRKLSFTGSTAVGRLLMAQCAPTIKKITLELGGNAPFIVFEDADLDQAVKGAVISKFRNTGQTCVCTNRFLIHESIYEVFATKLVKAVEQIKVGNGLEENVQQGPLINQAAIAKVQDHLNDATHKGAKILCGGKPHSLGGFFFEPTVLAEVNPTMKIAQEETFGPLAPLFKFKTDEEALEMANNTEFGLASYFYTQSISRIWSIGERLEYGMVGVNTGLISNEVAPFGGIKQSGIGREGSKYGVEPYLEIKYFCIEN